MSAASLNDLDRCEHGRHALDTCFSCPDGWSTGNLFLVDGQRIGTTLYGEPIVVERARRASSLVPDPAGSQNETGEGE